MTIIRSRDNARVKRWAKLVQDGRFRREEKRVVLEGPHLVGAAVDRGLVPSLLIASESGLADREIEALIARAGAVPVVLADSVFKAIADADTPQGIAAEIVLPASSESARGHAVFLEGVQDPGNVGAIVRTAAAFGVASVILDRACADPWSPKALRAGMGGHFSVSIGQVPDLEAAATAFDGDLVAAVSRGGQNIRRLSLSRRVGWLFGSEGAGLSAQLEQKARHRVTIPMAPGAESLNVAAAAAICLYEASSRPASGS
jgi:TrmH family RNA methyltransferase